MAQKNLHKVTLDYKKHTLLLTALEHVLPNLRLIIDIHVLPSGAHSKKAIKKGQTLGGSTDLVWNHLGYQKPQSTSALIQIELYTDAKGKVSVADIYHEATHAALFISTLTPWKFSSLAYGKKAELIPYITGVIAESLLTGEDPSSLPDGWLDRKR